jgi:uroporphyrinogen-III synthase
MPILVLTRTQEDNEDIIEQYKDTDIEFFSFPMLDFTEPNSFEELDKAIKSNHTYDWIFFLSKKSVTSFFDRLVALGGQFFHLSPNLKIACVGDSTRRFVEEEIGFPVDFVPSKFNADSLCIEFARKYANSGFNNNLELKKILIPRNADLDDNISERFEGKFQVDIVSAYRCLPYNPSVEQIAQLQKLINQNRDIYISIASSQTARFLAQILNLLSYHRGVKILSIGPKTTETLKKVLPKVEVITASEASFEAKINELLSRDKIN